MGYPFFHGLWQGGGGVRTPATGGGSLLSVGLGVDDSYVGSITVTPPGTVYGPFSGGGGGGQLCIATLSIASGTIVTFDASSTPVGSSWSSSFLDQISVGSADPLITTINTNIDEFGPANPCTAPDGQIYFQSFA